MFDDNHNMAANSEQNAAKDEKLNASKTNKQKKETQEYAMKIRLIQ